MSVIDEDPLPCGSGRVLTISTFVLVSAAAVVLALGTYDARLLRLGLVAALWAALLGAFAVARMRRDSRSCADQVDQLRTVYRLELEREVAARREHTLTVERELHEQAELAQRQEIVELRAELAAMRANLDQLVRESSLLDRVAARAEPARLLPLPTHPRKLEDTRSRPVAVATAAVASAMPSPNGSELRFGPGRSTPSRWSAPSPVDNGTSPGGVSNNQGRHGGAGPSSASAPPAQRTVSDLLAAHGIAPAPRRRHNPE
jgi:uncharacterized protein DUF6779